MISIPTRRSVPSATASINALTLKGHPRIMRLISTVSNWPDPLPANLTFIFLLGTGCRFNSNRSSLDMLVATSLPVSNKTRQCPGTGITLPHAFCICTGSSSLDMMKALYPGKQYKKKGVFCGDTNFSQIVLKLDLLKICD